MKECRWLRPVLVAQLEFLEWTADNHLRHTTFIGLRGTSRREPFGGSRTQRRMARSVIVSASMPTCRADSLDARESQRQAARVVRALL